ncbi:hypothetical protein OUZ56_031840 [Daphnia magna]|uniref:Uncharacterized protein n=1 Tax=Daphnia magna TaxID=35525 RepID=A0ABQ9ZVC9_9CRUS|nr:hypothetical protein OUZ56_031840 [Daphnia magna]
MDYEDQGKVFPFDTLKMQHCVCSTGSTLGPGDPGGLFPKRGDWTLRLIEIEDHKMQGGDLSFKNA